MSLNSSMESKENYRKYVLVLSLSQGKVENKRPHKQYKRSFLGCMRCKEKKIKCDELKPRCENCKKSRLTCIWPNRKSPKKKGNLEVSPRKRDATLSQLKSTWRPDLISIDSPLSTDIKVETKGNFLQYIFKDSYPSYISRIGLPDQESVFSSFFLNKFLPSMARHYFQETYYLSTLFLEKAKEVSILQELIYACGASMLAYEDHLYVNIARKRYKKAISLFIEKIKQGFIRGSEDWLLVAVQTLQVFSLRDRHIGPNTTQCASHFSATCAIVRRRLINSLQKNYQEQSIGTSGEICLVLEGKDSNVSVALSPLIEFMTENFIFNYSMTIFFRKHDSLKRDIPNPFEVFSLCKSKIISRKSENEIRRFSLYTASRFAFEIAAKCSWLLRLWLPLSCDHRIILQAMLEDAKENLDSLNIFAIQDIPTEYKKTISLAKIILIPSIILLKKMLLFEHLEAVDFQNDIDYLISEIDQPFNDDSILPVWSLMIAALTSVTSNRRQFFTSKIKMLSNRINSNIMLQIMNYLEGIWEIYQEENELFELLFDTKALDLVCS
ncbi:uncharacterized protein PRCAT00005006001 [Priceomyces carsonii]|uniref:uncharacterized protein n=1 Tax=Priceomyces carsonii TaxID=28549 RepID=UPI002EDB24C0|nr:unnamed protein product [Priceomyces carsonii]